VHPGIPATRWLALTFLASLGCQGQTAEAGPRGGGDPTEEPSSTEERDASVRTDEPGTPQPPVTQPAIPAPANPDPSDAAPSASPVSSVGGDVPTAGFDAGSELVDVPAGYHCRDSDQTVPEGDLCNRVADCPLGDDEPCSAPVAACPPQAAIVAEWLGSQSVCNIAGLGPGRDDGPAITAVQCESGEALFERMFCNGTADCASGEDEAGCPIVCTEGECAFPCADGAATVPLDALCDGSLHCPGGEDEPCVDRYWCDAALSIPLDQVCDGTPDCADGRDEGTCPPTFFLCDDGEQLVFPFVRLVEPGGFCTLPQCEDESDVICINPP
jgi:hypothetical protein